MVRPRKLKDIGYLPNITYFKPKGVPLRELDEIEISLDELETLRLSNIENLNQIQAAEKMNIHQSTFQRTLTRAREKITDALVNGKAIKLNGGNYKMPNRDGTGPDGKGPRTGRGMGNCQGGDEQLDNSRPKMKGRCGQGKRRRGCD